MKNLISATVFAGMSLAVQPFCFGGNLRPVVAETSTIQQAAALTPTTILVPIVTTPITIMPTLVPVTAPTILPQPTGPILFPTNPILYPTTSLG